MSKSGQICEFVAKPQGDRFVPIFCKSPNLPRFDRLKNKFVAALVVIVVSLQISFGFCESGPSYIAIYGDSRTGHDIHREIVTEMMRYKPGVVFHTGDMVYDDPKGWAVFNEITSELMKKAEFYPALGNHEYNAGAELFLDNFELPNNEQWYSVERQAIHFIVLDSNASLVTVSEQYKWLKSDLESIGDDIKFTVVILHHPLFSSVKNTDLILRFSLEPIFEQYGVDIVFSGHAHSYERYFNNDIFYITTGGAGAPLHSQIWKRMYSQKFVKAYHFCLLHVKDNELFIDVLDKDSNLIDQFSIQTKRHGRTN